jgi:hypothetical protein
MLGRLQATGSEFENAVVIKNPEKILGRAPSSFHFLDLFSWSFFTALLVQRRKNRIELTEAVTMQLDQARLLDLLVPELRHSPLIDPHG